MIGYVGHAFELAQAGLDTLSIENSGSGAVWTARKDLISYLLSETLTNGEIDPNNKNLKTAQNCFQQVLKYKTNDRRDPDTTPADLSKLSRENVVLICDFSRFGTEDRDCHGKKKVGYVCDNSFKVLKPITPGWKECQDPKNSVTAVSAKFEG